MPISSNRIVRSLGVTLSLALLLGCENSEPDPSATAMLLPASIGEWVKTNEAVTYDRETIFDYINGAGEVYRSYAFTHVLVERYESPGGQGVTVELFDMGRPEDAFGVFSYSRENEEEGIGAGFERKGSILCFWQNRFFVCVAAEQRDEGTDRMLTDLARGLSGALPTEGEKPPLMAVLPEDGRVPFSDRFFHTHQSLNYHYYLERENVLNLTAETDVALARYRPGAAFLLVIGYGDDGEASGALTSFREKIGAGPGDPGGAIPEGAATVETEKGTFLSSDRRGRFVVVVLDADTEEAANALLASSLENLTHLPD
jgi:hypothetical protein